MIPQLLVQWGFEDCGKYRNGPRRYFKRTGKTTLHLEVRECGNSFLVKVKELRAGKFENPEDALVSWAWMDFERPNLRDSPVTMLRADSGRALEVVQSEFAPHFDHIRELTPEEACLVVVG